MPKRKPETMNEAAMRMFQANGDMCTCEHPIVVHFRKIEEYPCTMGCDCRQFVSNLEEEKGNSL